MSTPTNWRTRDFRIVRGEGGNYKVQYYTTKEARDAAGRKFADRDGTSVIGELWSKDHPQDSLNQGWACDAVYRPRDVCVNCGGTVEHEKHGGHGRPVVDVWLHVLSGKHECTSIMNTTALPRRAVQAERSHT